MMLFVIIFISVDVLLVAFAIIKGKSLPVEHMVSISKVFKASPEALWNIVIDRKNLPTWRRDLNSVEVIDAYHWTEISGSDKIQYQATQTDTPTSLETKIMNTDLPYGGGWTYEFMPDVEGTQLTITEHGEVYNPFFRFVSKYIMGHDSTIKNYMADLEKKVSKS